MSKYDISKIDPEIPCTEFKRIDILHAFVKFLSDSEKFFSAVGTPQASFEQVDELFKEGSFILSMFHCTGRAFEMTPPAMFRYGADSVLFMIKLSHLVLGLDEKFKNDPDYNDSAECTKEYSAKVTECVIRILGDVFESAYRYIELDVKHDGKLINTRPEVLKYLMEERFHLTPMEDDEHVSEIN